METNQAAVRELQRLLSYARRAVEDYDMIKEGDKIAVGISGGKDSLALLVALSELRRFYPAKYEIIAMTADMGFEGMDFSGVEELCRELGVEYRTVKTQIAKIVFDTRKEKNPCSLCARMRRGALYGEAKELGCTRFALGHHFDDAVDTFMLNLFYEGRIGTFSPVTYLSKTDLYLIRPLIYMPEKSVAYYVNKAKLPVVSSTCPANKNTERENIKNLMLTLERDNKGLRQRIFGAVCRAGIDGYTDPGRLPLEE